MEDENLLVRHFLYELKTYLGLSNPSHSPEEAWLSYHPSASNLRSKYLFKFIKYILPSSKVWTRVWFVGHRDVYLHSASISRENIVLYIELVLKLQTQLLQKTYYYERATSDESILGIHKETRHRLLSLLIISDSENICIRNSQRDFVLDLYISSWVALWRH